MSQVEAYARELPRATGQRAVLVMLGLVTAVGSIVYFEPAPVDVGVVLLLVVAGASSLLRFDRSASLALTAWWVFVVVTVVSLFAAVDVSNGLRFAGITVYLALSWILFTGLSQQFGTRATNAAFLGYCSGALAAAALCLLTLWAPIPLLRRSLWKWGRAVGFFKDPNVFGPFLVPVVLYTMKRFHIETNPLRKCMWLGCAILGSTGVLLSFSRGAWLNYALALTTYVLLQIVTAESIRRAVFRSTRYLLVALLTVAILWSVIVSLHLQGFFALRLGLQQYDSVRFAVQREALNLATASLWGIGPGQAEGTLNYSTHNLFLRLFLENGILGLLAFTGLLAASVVRSLRRFLQTAHEGRFSGFHDVLAASLVGIAANSLVVDTLHWRHLWWLLGLAWTTPASVPRNLKAEVVGDE